MGAVYNNTILVHNITTLLTTATLNLTTAVLNTTNTTNITETTLKKMSSSYTQKYQWIDICLLISFCLIFVVGVCGNSLVCYYFRFNSKKLNGMARLIYYLAIVDLLASIINPVLYFYWQITNNRKWHFGFIGCKVLPVLAKCTITISFGIILLITIDRCIVISRPFHPRMKDRHMKIALLIIILYSVLCEVPIMIYSEIYPGYTCLVPDLRVNGFFYPSIVIYLSRDVMFFTTFITTVSLIYLELYNKEGVKTLKQQKDLSKNKSVMKMLVTLAVVFIILVFPREILHIVYMMSWKYGKGIPHSDTIRNVNATFKVLHMCNSVCNVFIYAGLHGRFRNKLLRFIFKLFGKRYETSSFVTSISESAYDEEKYVDSKQSFLTASSSGKLCPLDEGRYKVRASTNTIDYNFRLIPTTDLYK